MTHIQVTVNTIIRHIKTQKIYEVKAIKWNDFRQENQVEMKDENGQDFFKTDTNLKIGRWEVV